MRYFISFCIAGLVHSLVTSGSATAEDYVHCYIGDAPAHAQLSTTKNLQRFLTSIQIASLRHGCSLDTTPDKRMLDTQIAQAGCSPNSEVAGFAAETFAKSPVETLAMLRRDSGGDTALLTHLCDVAATCTPSEMGFTDDCKQKLATAMAQQSRRF